MRGHPWAGPGRSVEACEPAEWVSPRLADAVLPRPLQPNELQYIGSD
jgi:hypothetical protein